MRLFTVRWDKKFPSWAVPLFLGSFSFFAYLETLPSTISFEDSAEFVTASASLGIAHPSGYPLYVLLGHLFSLLPFGTVSWRVALLSAVCAAAAVAVLFVAGREIVEFLGRRADAATEMVMAGCSAAFALSPLWWSQAVYAKVYALHVLLLGLVALYLLRWATTNSERNIFLVALFFGLACANHLFLTLAAGPWLIAALIMGSGEGRRLRKAAVVVAGVAAGMLPYAYIALRMPTAPYATVTFDHAAQLLKFVLRSNYADVGVGGGEKFWLLLILCANALADVGMGVAALATFGAHGLVQRGIRRQARAAGIFWLGVIAVPLFIVGFRSIGFSGEAAYLYRVYGLSSEAFVSALAAVGMAVIWQSAAARRFGVARYALSMLAVALPILSAINAAPAVRLAADPFVEQWLRSTLESLPPEAVLVVSEEGTVSDTELFGLSYLQVTEGLRRDVTVVTDMGIRPLYRPELPAGESRFPLPIQRRMLLEATLRDPALAARPLFTSFPPEVVAAQYRSRATGYVFALDEDAALPAAPLYRLPADAGSSYAAAKITAHLGYLEAARITETDGVRAAMPALQKAMNLDQEPESSDYVGFVRHRGATVEVER